MNVTVPSSTPGSSTSCCALLQRCTSSTNRTTGIRLPFARSMILRASATPEATADSCWTSPPDLARQQVGERRLPGPGRPPQDHRRERAGADQRRQGLALAEQVPLPDHLVERAGAHAVRQRLAHGASMLVTRPAGRRVKPVTSRADVGSMQPRDRPAPAPAGASERPDDSDLHPWRAAMLITLRVRRRRAGLHALDHAEGRRPERLVHPRRRLATRPGGELCGRRRVSLSVRRQSVLRGRPPAGGRPGPGRRDRQAPRPHAERPVPTAPPHPLAGVRSLRRRPVLHGDPVRTPSPGGGRRCPDGATPDPVRGGPARVAARRRHLGAFRGTDGTRVRFARRRRYRAGPAHAGRRPDRPRGRLQAVGAPGPAADRRGGAHPASRSDARVGPRRSRRRLRHPARARLVASRRRRSSGRGRSRSSDTRAVWVPRTARVLVGTPFRSLAVVCSIAVAWRIRGRTDDVGASRRPGFGARARGCCSSRSCSGITWRRPGRLLAYEVVRTGRVVRTLLFGSCALLVVRGASPPHPLVAGRDRAARPRSRWPALAEALALVDHPQTDARSRPPSRPARRRRPACPWRARTASRADRAARRWARTARR